MVFGAPSTGKSFALEGPQLTGASGQAAGIVPRAADAIFGHLQPVPRGKYRLQATLSGVSVLCCGGIHASVLLLTQIYFISGAGLRL